VQHTVLVHMLIILTPVNSQLYVKTMG